MLFKIYPETLNFNSKKTNKPIKNREKHLNRNLTKEDIQMANKHMKKCSTASVTMSLLSHFSCVQLCVTP